MSDGDQISVDSSYSSISDFGEITEIEMIIQEFENEQMLLNQEAGPSQRRRYIRREREIAEQRLRSDYFGENPYIQNNPRY